MNFGIGIATAGIIATMAAGVASATTGGQQQAAGSVAAATSSVNRHITGAQARHIARAKVPHSRVIEVESDDLHNRAVWKVKLATPHGRVVVDVDKRTGQATIVRRGGGGHDDAIAAGRIAGQGREAGDDRGAGEVADDRNRARLTRRRVRQDLGSDVLAFPSGCAKPPGQAGACALAEASAIVRDLCADAGGTSVISASKGCCMTQRGR